MPRVLIVAHHFPPTGTGGVGRALGWARHLPDLGWDVTILAATPTPNWPQDEALTRQIHANVTVHRVASADPRPDSFRGLGHRELSFLWYRPALKFARALLAKEKFDVMLATSPPPTSLKLAAQLGQEFKLPWVADFRDPWAVREPGPWCRRRRRVYTKLAKAIIAVNPTLAAHLKESLNRKVTVVHNGFEPDEILTNVDRVPRRAVFLGTLPALDTMAPFFKALARGNGEFLHVGHPSTDLAAVVAAEGLKKVEQAGYLPRTEALRKAATGSVFVTALAPDLNLTLPTKVFDYIGLGGPILHLGDKGATTEFIAQHKLGESVSPLQVAAIATTLERIWSRPDLYSEDLKYQFERRRQAEWTAAILMDVVKGRAT